MSKRSGIMLAYPFEERRLMEAKFGWKFPVIVQPKLDGERCRAVPTGNGFKLLSSECNEIISVPHIAERLTKIFKEDSTIELDGELYVHGWSFNEIHSVVSRRSEETRHEKSELMQLHLFDVVSSEQQLVRTTLLRRLPQSYSVRVVPHIIASNMNDILDIYKRYLSVHYEGIIIRHIDAPYMRKRSRFMLKFKSKKEDFYKIVEVIEALNKNGLPLRMVGAFRCIGSDETVFGIGAGNLSHQKRKDLWKDRASLIGKFCRVQYQSILSGGSPRFGLCKSIEDENPEDISIKGVL
jgi:ATP-dependent DNA ligase